MGADKALLPFGEELMLQRVTRLLAEAVSPIVIVAAQGQKLPHCSVPTIIVRDEHPERGPLEGLHAGLTAIAPLADAAYVTSVDVPLLSPAFVRQMVAELGAADLAVPAETHEGRAFYHPLAAVYHTRVIPFVQQHLATDQLRLSLLVEAVTSNRIPVEQLRAVDPHLDSLRNLNCQDDYRAALAAAGLPEA